MADFIPRLNSDGIYNNKYWYSDNPFYQANLGLPNCTCYAWGRFWEISGIKPTLPTWDGGEWFADVVASGVYKTGQTPQLGAVACYGKAGDAGHVAIVEKISSGSVTISQSGYYRPISSYPPDTPNYFWLDDCPKSTMLAPWMGDYYFQGFIYNPFEPVPPIPPSKNKKMPLWLMAKHPF